MLSDDRTGLLKAFLGGLPGSIAARLAKAVEMDRLMDGKALPHEQILTSLRPALRRDGYDRTPTPMRLFCLPFQELLFSGTRKTKQKAVIARSSVMPLWRWLSETLLPGETARYVTDVKRLLVADKAEEAMARAEIFWAVAGEAVVGGFADEKAARLAMGGDLGLADAREFALLLNAGSTILKIHALMPVPMPAMGDSTLWQLRTIYDELAQSRPDVAPYVAVVAMNRLARPWEALKLPLLIARQTQDTLISQTDMGLVGEILFARLDALQASIRGARHPVFDAEKLLEETKNFAELSSAIVKEIAVRRDGEWGQRLLKDRAAVGEVLEGFMDRAAKEVAAALPMQKGAGKAADFTRTTDADRRELALRYARLVAGSRNFAAAASFAAKQKDAFEGASAYLRRYNEDVVKEMRTGEPSRRTVVESQFEFATELTALLFSAEEAALMRRRGAAAQSAAA